MSGSTGRRCPICFLVSFPGVKTSRDGLLVDVDLDRLRARVRDYFDPDVSHEEIARRHPAAMKTTSGFNARKVRDELLARGGPNEGGFVRFAYRPFDTRWLYWESDGSLLDRPRPDYRSHVFEGNLWLSEVPRLRRDAAEPQAVVTSALASLHLIEWSASMFPAWLRDDTWGTDAGGEHHPNLSGAAQRYLDRLGASVEDLFHYVLAALHDPAYRKANAGALRMEWPRIPLPGWSDGCNEGAATTLARSAAWGRELAPSPRPRHARSGSPLRVSCVLRIAHHRRARYRVRPQHDRRGLRVDGRMGPFRIG